MPWSKVAALPGAAVTTNQPTPKEAHGAPPQSGIYRSPHAVPGSGRRVGLSCDDGRHVIRGTAARQVAARLERNDRLWRPRFTRPGAERAARAAAERAPPAIPDRARGGATPAGRSSRNDWPTHCSQAAGQDQGKAYNQTKPASATPNFQDEAPRPVTAAKACEAKYQIRTGEEDSGAKEAAAQARRQASRPAAAHFIHATRTGRATGSDSS